MQNYDRIILGAGLYGLYSALFCGKRGEHVMVLERESSPFLRATYINQARVHMGYHYPRSISTALKSRHYFDRFVNDFGFCIKQDFDQVYATSSCFSWTSANQFQSFCKNANIPCEEIPSARYFRPGACDGAFLTKEFTYDALLLKEHLIHEIEKFSNIELVYSARDIDIKAESEVYLIRVNNEEPVTTGFVLNATYASVNQVLCQLKFQPDSTARPHRRE